MDKIYVIKNVLKEKERKKLLEDSIHLLVGTKELREIFKTNSEYPGKQTAPDLHKRPEFQPLMEKIASQAGAKISLNSGRTHITLEMKAAWVNWTNGTNKDICWHNHSRYDYSIVYYLKTFPFFSNGTLFREPIGFIKAPQNSMLVLPGHLDHTAPTSPFRFNRYTVAIDLNIPNNIHGNYFDG
tara:strand:+ start:251 stop:802 length:552 start_codon:yes stop_codon:yes gene_type:complete